MSSVQQLLAQLTIRAMRYPCVPQARLTRLGAADGTLPPCCRYEYTGIACPDMKKAGVCLREDRCPYAHNAFEYWLHPTRYRTQLCNAGPGCRRKVCFFAHRLEELRAPVCKPYVSPETLARASLEAIHANPHPLGAQMSLGDLGAPAQALLQPTALGPLSEAHASLQGQATAGFASLLGTPYSDGFAAGQMARASSALQMQLRQQAELASLGVSGLLAPPSQTPQPGRASSDFSNQAGSAGFAAGYTQSPSALAAESSQAFPSSERPGDSQGLDL